METRHKLDSFKKNEGFKTPESYFDTVNSRVMNSLPKKDITNNEVEEVTRWMKLKPISYLAAMFVGAALIIKIALPTFATQEDVVVAEVVDIESASDMFIQETIEGAMFDDYSMYVYLSENIEGYDE